MQPRMGSERISLTDREVCAKNLSRYCVSVCLKVCLATGLRSPAEAKDFPSSLCAQTGSDAHPSSYPMGTGGPIPGVKCGRGATLTTHPSLVSTSNISSSYIFSHLGVCVEVARQLYFLLRRKHAKSEFG
jgi:hypothetical protein